jgi:hypothetical protein
MLFTTFAEDCPYRPGMDKEDVWSIISDLAGRNHLDARIVALLFENCGEINCYAREKQLSVKEFYESHVRFSI